jgi:hypothetical protein
MESNHPAVGLPRPAGFEDRTGFERKGALQSRLQGEMTCPAPRSAPSRRANERESRLPPTTKNHLGGGRETPQGRAGNARSATKLMVSLVSRVSLARVPRFKAPDATAPPSCRCRRPQPLRPLGALESRIRASGAISRHGARHYDRKPRPNGTRRQPRTTPEGRAANARSTS